MPEMYAVEVLAKQDRTVTLDVRMAHPDAIPPSTDLGAAFMMLCHSATPSSVLGNEVRAELYGEPAWLVKNTRGYVGNVKVKSRKKATTKTRASAQLAIEVTDPAWIEHLAVGQCWSSTAFIPTVFVEQKDYDTRKPADPKKARVKQAAAKTKPVQLSATDWTPVTGNAVILVPLAAWGDVTFAHHGAPAEVPVFAYPIEAYVEVNRIENPTIDEARALHGQLIRRHSRSSRNPKPDDGYIVAHTHDETIAYFLTVDFNAYWMTADWAIPPISVLGVKCGGSYQRKTLDEVLTTKAKEAIAHADNATAAAAKAAPVAKREVKAKPAAKPVKLAKPTKPTKGKGNAKRRAR